MYDNYYFAKQPYHNYRLRGRNARFRSTIKTKMITKQQIKIAQTLLSVCHLRAQKANILLGFSDGRTEHVSELEHDEAAELIRFLQKKKFALDRKAADPHAASVDKMKRKIISMAHEMNWKTPAGRIDMKKVNGWCVKYGHQHKALDRYTYAELPALINQFQNMYTQYIKRQ